MTTQLTWSLVFITTACLPKCNLPDQATVGSPLAGADETRASADAKAMARQELAHKDNLMIRLSCRK